MTEIQIAATRRKEPGQAEIDSYTDAPSATVDALDSEQSLRELRQAQEWWCESRDLHAENRAQMVQDHDYYDNLQWSPEERAVMIARGQAPMVYNKLSMMVDWLTGTERRTRVDYSVHPRNEAGIDDAKNKEKLLKYLSDVNRTGWDRSRAFKDAVIGGIGWTEQAVRCDSAEEMLRDGWVPWQQVWYDPFTRDMALKDCRYLHRRRWVDLDFALAMFPGRAKVIRAAARSHLFTDEDLLDDELDLPQPFRRYDSAGHEIVQRRWSSAFPSEGGSSRLRVPLCETWWRCPRPIKKLWGLDYPGVEYDEANDDHVQAAGSGYCSLTDSVDNEIRLSIWVPSGLLFSGESPYNHKQFPLTPIWGKMRSNDGMAYGVVRGVRDAQDDLNHTNSKKKWYLSSNQFFYEDDAVELEDMPEIRRNLAKPNGEIKLKPGGLKKIEVNRGFEAAKALTEYGQEAAAHIHDGTGVNREQLGRDTNATSGKAIRAKQEEGSVSTAEFFDNERLAVQLAGEKDLSNVEQFMTLPMQLWLEGEDGGQRNSEWLMLNQLDQAPDGSWSIKNDITKNAAKFVVDQQDFRETVRQAQSEQFFEMLAGMPPDVQIQFLDLALETTDLRQRQELVKRARKINGQPDPDNENKPEERQRQALVEQQQQQDAAQQREIAVRGQLAKAGLDEQKAAHLAAQTKNVNLNSKSTALDIVQLLQALLPLAPAADRIFHGTAPEDPNGPAAAATSGQ